MDRPVRCSAAFMSKPTVFMTSAKYRRSKSASTLSLASW